MTDYISMTAGKQVSYIKSSFFQNNLSEKWQFPRSVHPESVSSIASLLGSRPT